MWRAFCAGIVLASCASMPARETAPAPPLTYSTYPLDEPIAAQLGAFDVPENRDDPHSRTITIKFVRLPSTAAQPGAPIVYLAGGPGGSGIDTLGQPRGRLMRRLRAVGDVILLDQRGAGQSNAIPACDPATELSPLQLTGTEIVAFYREAFAHCLAQWRAAGVDPRGYDLVDAAADVEDLRRALGVDRLNLLTISFGGQLGMAYVQLYPNRVARAIFASPRALHQILRLPADIDAVITRNLGPDVAARMRRVHARLDQTPATVAVTPQGGTPIDVRFDSWPLRYVVAFFLMNDARGFARIPQIYEQLDQGNYAPMAESILTLGLDPQRGRFNNFRGMGEIMDVSSGAGSPQRYALWRSQLAGSILGDAHGFPMPQMLGVDSALGIPDALKTPLSTDVPSLFISSSHDGRTPREEVVEAMSHFSRAEMLTVENGGHNVFEQSEEIEGAVERFLRGEALVTHAITLPAP